MAKDDDRPLGKNCPGGIRMNYVLHGRSEKCTLFYRTATLFTEAREPEVLSADAISNAVISRGDLADSTG